MNALEGIIKNGKWIVKDLPPDVTVTLEDAHLHLVCGDLWVDLYAESICMMRGLPPSSLLRYAALLKIAHEVWEQGYGDWQYKKEESRG